MKIVIVGAGRIGRNLSRSLSEGNHEIYLIDSNDKRVQLANEKLDVKVVYGSGSDPDILRSVNVSDADLVIAVTRSDETNLVVCALAATFGAKRRIARVRNAALSQMMDDYGYRNFNIDEIINPELLAAQTVVRAINSPGASEVSDFAEGRLLLRAFDVSKKSSFAGASIQDVNIEDFPWPFLIIAIARNNEVKIPKGDTIIQEHDRIYVLLPQNSLVEFLSFIDPDTHMPRKVVIYGASITGEFVASTLSHTVKDVVLIEENMDKAEEMASHLQNVTVIQGSAAEADILSEAGIEASDVFLATASNDHSNLVSSVLAKKLGAKTTMITTQQSDYMTIVDQLDIDVIINPHHLAVNQLLHLIQGTRITTVTQILEGNAEAIELIPEEESPVTQALVKDLRFPRNAIIGAVSRVDESFLVNGNTQIVAGDKVVVFCDQAALKKVQDMFNK